MVRLRHRYIVAKINYETQTRRLDGNKNSSILFNALMKSIRDLHGLHGVALVKSGLFVNYFNTDTNVFFIRMRRSAYQIVPSSLAMLRLLNSEPMSVQTLYTGATIKQCNKFLQTYYRRELESSYENVKTPGQKLEFDEILRKAASKPVVISFQKSR